MRPPNNSRALVAWLAMPIAALFLAVLCCALASCGAQPAAASIPEIPDSSIAKTFNPMDTCTQLECRILRLSHYGPMWYDVGRVESAMGTEGVGLQNNLFGMQCNDRELVIGCQFGYACYLDPLHAVTDLQAWIDHDPPRELTLPILGHVWLEHPYAFLHRRHWNPNLPEYWAYLQTLNQ